MRLRNSWEFVPNYYQALGPCPQQLQVDVVTHVMFVERTLPREIKDQIAFVGEMASISKTLQLSY